MRAACRAAPKPAGPPPTTRTSVSAATGISRLFAFSILCCLVEEHSNRKHSQRKEQQAERPCYEDGQRIAGHYHRVAEIRFHQITKNYAEDDRYNTESKPAQQERKRADDDRQKYLKCAGFARIDTGNAVNNDDCAHQLIRNACDIGIQWGKHTTDNQHQDIDNDKTNHNAV